MSDLASTLHPKPSTCPLNLTSWGLVGNKGICYMGMWGLCSLLPKEAPVSKLRMLGVPGRGEPKP